MKNVPRNWGLIIEFVKYLFFGGMTVFIYLTILYSLVTGMGFDYLLAAVIGLFVQWVLSYQLHVRYTFVAGKGSQWRPLIYLTAFTAVMVLEFLALRVAVEIFGYDYLWAAAVITLPAGAVSFVLTKLILKR